MHRFFETEIVRRHLLEAAVLLRFTQSGPIRRRDAHCYSGLPPHYLAPQALKGADVMRLASADVDADQRKWARYTFSHNQFGSEVRPDPQDLFTLCKCSAV